MKPTILAPSDSFAKPSDSHEDARQWCYGTPPLTPRLEGWMRDCLRHPELADWVEGYGSPLNIVATAPMHRNIERLRRVAVAHQVPLQIFFARKANKCLAFVEQARESAIAVDTASDQELQQTLEAGVPSEQLICTAAVKPDDLIARCVQSNVVIAVDNQDELDAITHYCHLHHRRASIALRLGGFHHQGHKLATRFGFDVDRDRDLPQRLRSLPLDVAGLHFHLDGYDAEQRVNAIRQTLPWFDRLGENSHRPSFMDIGGGFPMSYLESVSEWETFWTTLHAALRSECPPITRDNYGFGIRCIDSQLHGDPNIYPYFQRPTTQEWFDGILSANCGRTTVASELRQRGIQLRCEPGRSLLDGCGITIARVEFRKQDACGDWLIGLAMNQTQCRTTFDDFLVDPIVVPARGRESADFSRPNVEPDLLKSGFLVGGYCTESDFLSWRRFRFPRGIERGDLVVFPNTAGYLMHFMESRSHQFPLARNVVWSPESCTVALDAIER